jgi:hypothetical protein
MFSLLYLLHNFNDSIKGLEGKVIIRIDTYHGTKP